MKDVIGIIIFVAVVAIIVYIGVSTDVKCEKMGGVVVRSSSGMNNCWKDGNFVDL